MRRSIAKGGKVAKQIRRNSAKLRASTTPLRKRAAPKVAKLQEQLAEAQRHQSAMAEVLEVIGASEGELEPVFKAVLNNAIRLCKAKFGNLLLIDSQSVRWAAG